MSAGLAVAFSIFRSLSPGANSHDLALKISPWVAMSCDFPLRDRFEKSRCRRRCVVRDASLAGRSSP